MKQKYRKEQLKLIYSTFILPFRSTVDAYGDLGRLNIWIAGSNSARGTVVFQCLIMLLFMMYVKLPLCLAKHHVKKIYWRVEV